MDERKKMLTCVRQAIAPDKKIMFNVTAMNTIDMKDLIDYARREKVEAVSVTTPYYHRYDKKSLIEYFSEVSKMTEDMNLYLYNMEGMTGNPITPQLLKEVVENTSNVKGIKDSSMDFMRILEYQEILNDDDFELITGNDAQILTTLQADGAGAVVVFASVVPEICMEIWDEYQVGNIKKANARL
jgi:dihydrodipicolinate synthase/N-acetylneuraminate lyase